jgi:hypothetical protein
VRHCDVKIVRKDLEERNMLKGNMSEGQMRATMEVRLRLEEERKRLRILRKDTRFLNGGDGGVQNELDRTLVGLLRAPMRMNEKVPPSLSLPLCTCGEEQFKNTNDLEREKKNPQQDGKGCTGIFPSLLGEEIPFSPRR